jgi:hypothetical protein
MSNHVDFLVHIAGVGGNPLGLVGHIQPTLQLDIMSRDASWATVLVAA